MDDLFSQYLETRRKLQKALDQANEVDRPILSRMLFDVNWIIDYLQRKNDDTNKSRVRVTNPVGLNPYILKGARALWHELVSRGVADDSAARSTVEGLLQHLTKQEREVYLLIVAQGFSQREVADLMRLSRRRIRDIYEAANRKVITYAKMTERRYAHLLTI